jgi:hypothetical protein
MSLQSAHALATLHELVFSMLKIDARGKMKKKHQQALQDLAIMRAACEIVARGQMNKQELFQLMRVKYDSHSTVICSEVKGVKGFEFVDIKLFTHVDVNCTKARPDTFAANRALWRRYQTLKKNITNRDNKVVSKVMKKFQGTVPSGKSLESSFFPALVNGLYHAEQKEPEVKDPGPGGSASKAATGAAAFDEDDDEKAQDDNGDDDDEDDDGAGFSTSPSQNTRQAKRKSEDISAVSTSSLFDDEEQNAPASFIPETLCLIVDLGVLSAEIQPPLQYAIPQGTSTELSSSSSGPSRAELRDEVRKAKQARSSLSSVGGDENSVEIPKTKALSDRLDAWLDQRERGLENEAEVTLLMREHSKLEIKNQKLEIMNQKIQTVNELIELEDDDQIKTQLKEKSKKFLYEKLCQLEDPRGSV